VGSNPEYLPFVEYVGKILCHHRCDSSRNVVRLRFLAFLYVRFGSELGKSYLLPVQQLRGKSVDGVTTDPDDLASCKLEPTIEIFQALASYLVPS